MQDILITMADDGSFSFGENDSAGFVDEYKAKRLKIKVNSIFQNSSITYFTISFAPSGIHEKIVSDNIYKLMQYNSGDMYYMLGYIYCPIYDYMASAPCVSVQIDGYETNSKGDIVSIVKSGIFQLHFGNSLMGDSVEVDTVRADLKLSERINTAFEDNFEHMTIGTDKLLDNAVTTPKLLDKCVTSSKLADACVTNGKLAYGCVSTDKIEKDSISSEKIKSQSITQTKIQPLAITSELIADNAVKTGKIENLSITALKLAEKSVNSSKLADGAVTAQKLSESSVSSSVLQTGCVTSGKLADKSVSSSKICDGSVTPEKLDRVYLTEHQDISSKAEKSEIPSSLGDLLNDTAVSYCASQSLTENQKKLARKNIDAVKEGSFLSPSTLGKSGEILSSDGENFLWISSDFVPTENSLNPVSSGGVFNEISQKVDKTDGMGLSENSFSDEEKILLHSALQEHQSLDGYATQTWVEEKNYLTSHQDISQKADVSSLSTVSFSGSYNDLTDKPVIQNLFNENLKDEYDAAYLHSLSLHAPQNAEENVIEKIIVNETECPVQNKNVIISMPFLRKEKSVFIEVI